MKVAIVTLRPVDRPTLPNLRAQREGGSLRKAGYDIRYIHHEGWHYPAPPKGLLARRRFYKSQVNRLTGDVISFDPDIILAHDLDALEAGMIAAKRTGAKLVYDCHEDWLSLVQEHSWIEALAASQLERRALPHVDLALAPCRPILVHLANRGVSKTLLLYNARPTATVSPAGRKFSRDYLKYAPEDFVVGYIGTLRQLRGSKTVLFEAMDQIPSMKLLVVGGPEKHARLIRYAVRRQGLSDRCNITGYVSFDRLAKYYAAIDLGLLLLRDRKNYRISLPNKLFDYMAFGTPILASDYPEIRRIIEETGSGWTIPGWRFPHTRGEMLRGFLRRIQQDTEGRALCQLQGRHAFLRTYCWDKQEPLFLEAVGSL
jgi:glycosyltransferase involved in cell wall biosynthesis